MLEYKRVTKRKNVLNFLIAKLNTEGNYISGFSSQSYDICDILDMRDGS